MFSVIYLLLCIVVGLAGRRRRIGFTGFVLLALFLTPVLPLLYLLFTQKNSSSGRQRKGPTTSIAAAAADLRRAPLVVLTPGTAEPLFNAGTAASFAARSRPISRRRSICILSLSCA